MGILYYPQGPKYLNIVESRVAILGATIIVWGSVPHDNTLTLLGYTGLYQDSIAKPSDF